MCLSCKFDTDGLTSFPCYVTIKDDGAMGPFTQNGKGLGCLEASQDKAFASSVPSVELQAESLPRWDGPLSHPLYSKVFKRVLDFLMALVLLPFFLLFLIPIAALVKLTSKGPVFYRALRGGYHNKPFNILKFRTMVVGADKYSGTTALNDPRVTPLGRVLRKTKLDELPQIFNILKGDMSFIGPRPELLKYTTRYTKEQECILWVRPGISDPSSIKLISLDAAVGHDDPEGTYERQILEGKNAMRVAYVKSQSFFIDAALFFRTLSCVLQKMLSPAPREGAAPVLSKHLEE